MEFSKLVRHTDDSINARILNRQMDDLDKFRTMVASGKTSGQFFDAEDAHNEALRREVMQRHRNVNHLTEIKHDAAAEHAALKTTHDLLTKRGGHRGGR